ncbi:hypothetical protein LPC08_08710 [Roseomonas sp. OT10]|uniref:hypothetical protein n=1 Tax=Roseomonas cutis TaxID=2897332 RepID=UPI001E5B527D|nr:hypothetical protein [Roseomonas sp. OT10]UFN50678.1 hypothetical protein LPC08_08710 [Roseomonas sp. OT10]
MSRTLFAAEMVLIAMPASLFVVPFLLPAIVLLVPVALLGLVHTVLAGGPRMGEELWTGLGLLLMAMLCLCAVAALFLFVGLGGRFLLLGRDGLRGQGRAARIAILLAAPPILLSSLPRLYAEASAGPLDLNRMAAALMYSGLPLLIPAAHLLIELRACLRSPARPGA